MAGIRPPHQATSTVYGERLGDDDGRDLSSLDDVFAAWRLVLAPDVHLRVGSRPVVLGRAKALAELSKLVDQSHESVTKFRQTFRSRDVIVVETSLQPTEGSLRDVPCAMIARSENGWMVDVRLYLDLGAFRY